MALTVGVYFSDRVESIATMGGVVLLPKLGKVKPLVSILANWVFTGFVTLDIAVFMGVETFLTAVLTEVHETRLLAKTAKRRGMRGTRFIGGIRRVQFKLETKFNDVCSKNNGFFLIIHSLGGLSLDIGV